jgi:ribosomal protein L11 methyltransferase
VSAAGWNLVVDCRGLRDDERELLAGELWGHPISAIEERADELVAGFADECAARAAAGALRAPATVVEVVDDGYLDEWRRFAVASSVGRLFVRPSWVNARRPAGAVEIVVDPHRSFGSGAHPSTHLALVLLQEHDLRDRTVLDVGCGSGVLSIAACALGAARVVAIDVDPDAVAATRANARRNGVGERVDTRVATPHDVAEPFAVAVANVLPSIHREIAPEIRRIAAPLVIVSGLLDAQVDDVESAYRARRITLSRQDGWAALSLRVDPGNAAL